MKALYYENDSRSLSLFPFPIASLEGKTFLQHHLFHEPNCVASNYNVARVLTQKLKLDYENIHPCAKRCVLFQRDHNDDVSYPKCGSVQYKDVINKVLSMKVFCHFSIVPRLQ